MYESCFDAKRAETERENTLLVRELTEVPQTHLRLRFLQTIALYKMRRPPNHRNASSHSITRYSWGSESRFGCKEDRNRTEKYTNRTFRSPPRLKRRLRFLPTIAIYKIHDLQITATRPHSHTVNSYVWTNYTANGICLYAKNLYLMFNSFVIFYDF